MDTKSNKPHDQEDSPSVSVNAPETAAPTTQDASSGVSKPDTEIAAPDKTAQPDASNANAASGGGSMSEEEEERLAQDIVAALKTVYDPEIPSDIYELGLIYRVEIFDDRDVDIDMTLTAPACPVAGEMPVWVEDAVSAVPGVGRVKVNLTFEPPWDMSRMSDEARLALNMF